MTGFTQKLFLLLLVAFIGLDAYASRRVVFVLDDSGSMNGEKYKVADYALQFLSSVLNEEDEFYVVRGQDLLKINHTNAELRNIESWPQTGTGDFTLLQKSLSAFAQDGKENWLIVFADGEWGPCNPKEGGRGFSDDFAAFYSSIRPNIVFIQTLGGKSEIAQSTLQTELLKNYNLATTKTVIGGDIKNLSQHLSQVTEQILSTSQNKKFTTLSKQSIQYLPELPLSGLIVYYEDELTLKDIPQITDVAGLPGLRTAENFQNSNLQTPPPGARVALISSSVAHINNGRQLIPAGTKIQVTFDRPVDASKIHILPLAKLDINAGFVGNFKTQNPEKGYYEICDEEKEFVVELDATNLPGITDKSGLLKSLKAIVKVKEKSYQATFQNGRLTCTIPVSDDTTYLNIQVIKEGYLDKTLKTVVIVKTNCDYSSIIDTVSGGTIQFPDAALSAFIDKICSNGYIVSRQTGEALNPSDFDLELYDAPIGTSFKVNIVDSTYQICIQQNLCKCFMRQGQYQGKYKAKSKNRKYNSFEGTWQIKLATDQPWYIRCLKLIITLVALLALLIYIILLIKKPRFRKGSYVEYMKRDEYLPDDDARWIHYGPLPTGFVSRYLVPFIPETRHFDSLKFVADKNQSQILLPAGYLNEENTKKRGRKMEYFRYVKDNKNLKGEMLLNNDVVNVHKSDGITYNYRIIIPD